MRIIRPIILGITLCVAHTVPAMDNENAIFEQLRQRVDEILQAGGGMEDLTQDEFDTLDWLAWDRKPIVVNLAKKLLEKN